MSEIDDIKRLAGITEDFGGGTNPVEDIANAHVRADADGATLLNSIIAASGGDAKKALILGLQVIDRLSGFPGSSTRFIEKIKQANKTGGHVQGGTSGL